MIEVRIAGDFALDAFAFFADIIAQTLQLANQVVDFLQGSAGERCTNERTLLAANSPLLASLRVNGVSRRMNSRISPSKVAAASSTSRWAFAVVGVMNITPFDAKQGVDATQSARRNARYAGYIDNLLH